MFFNTGFQNPTDLKYGSAAYYKYMKYRSDLILNLLTAEVSLFVVEADATWYGDPGESLAKFENMDFVAGQDGGLKDEKIECGFLFMNATENAKTTEKLKERAYLNVFGGEKVGKKVKNTCNNKFGIEQFQQISVNFGRFRSISVNLS